MRLRNLFNKNKTPSISGELVIKGKHGKEEIKKIIFQNQKSKKYGGWKKIEYKATSKWVRIAVLECHKSVKEKVNLMNTKPYTSFNFRFTIDRQEYGVEIIVIAINELTKGERLVDKWLETETNVYKKEVINNP